MYVCMYVCALQQTAVVEEKGVCLLPALFLTKKRLFLIGWSVLWGMQTMFC